MSLLELPPEILITIFEYVGSQYFRSDLSRLTVCKQWHAFARTACLHHLRITHKTLRRLRSSPYADSNLDLVQDCAVIVDLELRGFEDWDSIPTPQNDSLLSNGHATRMRGVRSSWTSAYNDDIHCLGINIAKSRKLRNLRILAISEVDQFNAFYERRDYLLACTIRPFLSTKNLTTLELDLVGTRFAGSKKHTKEYHVCKSIAAHLTTLLRLRLRMREVCANVLDVGQNDNKLRLNEVIINLSLCNESPLITSATHATCCNTSSHGLFQLKHDIEEQARILVTQMANPRMVRVLTHTPPTIKMKAFDVLTGENIILEEEAEWDGDGKVIEEPVSDGESEISGLSSDSDA